MNTVILGMTVYQILWYFLIYSFIGWCIEVAYHAMKVHRLVNRGFLNGPVCPVYGFGVVLVFAAVHFIVAQTGGSFQDISLFLLFPIGVVLTTAVELFGGYMLDKAFHARWWNYSEEKFNLNGYICLKFSIIWGLGVVFLVKVAHPFIEGSTIALLPVKIGIWLAVFLCISYFADFVVSVLIMMKLNQSLAELDQIQKDMRIVSDQITKLVAGGSIAAEVIVDAGLTKAGLVSEDTMYAVLDQAFNAGDVIDNEAYNAEFKENGIPVQAGATVEAEVKAALTERKDTAVAAITEKRDEALNALTERRDDAVAAITEKRAEALNALTESRAEALNALTETRKDTAAAIADTKEAAADNIQQTKEALEQRLAVLRERASKISSNALRHRVFGPLRIIKAFPRLSHELYSDALQSLKKSANELMSSDNDNTDDNKAA